jgi:hypothetical protein
MKMTEVEARRIHLATQPDLTPAELNELRDCEITLGMTMAGSQARAEAARRIEARDLARRTAPPKSHAQIKREVNEILAGRHDGSSRATPGSYSLQSSGRSYSTTRGHATINVNEDRAKSIAFGTKWAEDRFREDPNYSAFTLDMVRIDPAVVPNAKKREAVKNLICTAAVKRWRMLRDQARLLAARGRSSIR